MPYTVAVALMTLGLTRRLVTRFGSLPVIAPGLAVAAAGMLMLLLLLGGTHAGFFPFLFLAFLGLGMGLGSAFGRLTMTEIAEVPHRETGLASGIVNVSQQVAGALGLALLNTIATIGVSNLTVTDLAWLAERSETVPAVNQVELHPNFQQDELRQYHRSHGIITEAWGPLAQGESLKQPMLPALTEKYGKRLRRN